MSEILDPAERLRLILNIIATRSADERMMSVPATMRFPLHNEQLYDAISIGIRRADIEIPSELPAEFAGARDLGVVSLKGEKPMRTLLQARVNWVGQTPPEAEQEVAVTGGEKEAFFSISLIPFFKNKVGELMIEFNVDSSGRITNIMHMYVDKFVPGLVGSHGRGAYVFMPQKSDEPPPPEALKMMLEVDNILQLTQYCELKPVIEGRGERRG